MSVYSAQRAVATGISRTSSTKGPASTYWRCVWRMRRGGVDRCWSEGDTALQSGRWIAVHAVSFDTLHWPALDCADLALLVLSLSGFRKPDEHQQGRSA